MLDIRVILYRFKFVDGSTVEFEVDQDRPPLPRGEAGSRAFWTRLAFHRCGNCPLPETDTACPAAVDLEAVTRRFQDVISHEAAEVEVVTPERMYRKSCDVQTGLRSLLGLIFATGRCPVLSRFKSLARYHLPFATIQESLFRFVSAHLLSQYFEHQAGRPAGFSLRGLADFLGEVEVVDQCFKRRLDAACEKDAALNAMGTLGLMAMCVRDSLEHEVEELRKEFCPDPER